MFPAVGFVKGKDAVLEYCIQRSFMELALYSNITATAFLRLKLFIYSCFC